MASIPSGCDIWYAALFTSTSIRPNSATARSTSARQLSSSRMSQETATALRPASSTSRDVSRASSASSGRCVNSTSAPSRANASATARPIPESPPVMTALRPSSRPAPRYDSSP
ncbi:hypothetical protein RKD25_002802 [Streptomyces sp. SAI-124]